MTTENLNPNGGPRLSLEELEDLVYHLQGRIEELEGTIDTLTGTQGLLGELEMNISHLMGLQKD